MGGKRPQGQKTGGQKTKGAKSQGAKDRGAKDQGANDRGAKVLEPSPIRIAVLFVTLKVLYLNNSDIVNRKHFLCK